jgi:uncharacterized protein (TIGR02996 family)
MITEADLRAPLEEDLHDTVAARVLADWLLTQPSLEAQVRGELINLAYARMTSPWLRRIVRREAQLMTQHRELLLGPLAAAPTIPNLVPGGDLNSFLSLGWEQGFIRRARLVTYGQLDMPQLLSWLESLLELPAAGLLDDLEVSLHRPRDDYQRIVDIIARRRRPALRELVLFGIGDRSDRNKAPCDLSPLAEALPRLETLNLAGDRVRIGARSFPRLSWFSVRGTLDDSSLDSIARARWPQLESLTIATRGRRGLARRLRPILDGRGLTKITSLAILRTDLSEHGDALCRALTTAPILPQLRELAIEGITRVGEAVLLAARERFAHLQMLHISRCSERLKGLCRFVHRQSIADTRRLERSDRFCEIEVPSEEREGVVRMREGAIGHRGGVRRVFTGDRARAQADLYTEAKLLDGYRLIDNRFVRYRPPYEQPYSLDELWRAIEDTPDDAAPYLAYADHLRGGWWLAPRAELIAIQHARTQRPDDERLVRREAELLREHADLFLGELAPHVLGQCSPRVSLTWRFGFARAAVVSACDGDDDVAAPAEVIEFLFGQRTGQLIETLRLELVADGSRAEAESAIARTRPRSLRKVEIAKASSALGSPRRQT